MKTRLNALVKYFSALSRRLSVTSNWQRALRSTRGMMGYLNRIPIILLGRSGRTWVLGSLAFARFALTLKSRSGFKGLAIVLKVSHTAVVKAVAGSKLSGTAGSLGHRVGLTRSGLPTWLPKAVRKAILKGDRITIRVWLSYLSSYRVLEYLGKPNISTITKPGVVFDVNPYLLFIPIFFKHLFKMTGEERNLEQWEPRVITKSGPGSVSVDARKQPPIPMYSTTSSLIVQAVAWFKPEFSELLLVFKNLALKLNQKTLYDKLSEVANGAKDIKVFQRWSPKYLAKLGIKEEPGKVRVFAMVDWWTQMLMRPVHLALFRILERIPSDATMNQDAGVKRGMRLIEKTQFAASYDLSAATDRLPVLLQSFLINHLWPGTGQLWAELLVGRSYQTPVKIRKLGMRIPESVDYAVGQPMGALSSWAMLALTHHFVVQFAAHKAGKRLWFSLYLVLGDDIVIFDKEVAKHYLSIMKDLGVGINLVKSVVSNTSFEFAKRFIHKGQNLSPISFKELDIAGASLEGAILLLSHFNKEGGWRISQLARFRGYGYRTLAMLNGPLDKLSRSIRLMLVFLAAPGISSVSFSRYVDWFGMTAIGQSSPVNPHSLYDVVMGWWNRSLPEGWNPSAKISLTPRHIWGDMDLDKIGDWRVEYLEPTLQSLMWPAQLKYLASHEKADAQRRVVYDTVPENGDLQGLEEFLQKFVEWDAQNSLTPIHVSLRDYRSCDVIRQRVGRWLRWWSVAQTKSLHK